MKSANMLHFSRAVRAALAQQAPVVALESTIITHGMPWPENLQCAKDVEAIVRENGAVPATIGILAGKIHVGMEDDELEALAMQRRKDVRKCSRRDLAVAVANEEYGGTTVAATMVIAHRAGIRVFVTGGIGGVHREAFATKDPTLDVSADLTELGRTPVAVVCAGVKSILVSLYECTLHSLGLTEDELSQHIGHTLEWLETQGVTVATLGQNNFPSFFTIDSGLESPVSVNSIDDMARIVQANIDLKLQSGMVIAVPNPEPVMDSREMQEIIAHALHEATLDPTVRGKAMTPFLLQRINEMTHGDSLRSNLALVKNNAKVGAQIAKKLSCQSRAQPFPTSSSRNGSIAVIGGATMDISAGPVTEMKTSNPGVITRSFGGVARNIAHAMALLSASNSSKPRIHLITAVGDDIDGRAIIAHAHSLGIDTSNSVVLSDHRTATYVAMTDSDGDLIAGVADMTILDEIDPPMISSENRFVIVDTNLRIDCLESISRRCIEEEIPLLLEPVSTVKARKAVGIVDRINFMTPNRLELFEMLHQLDAYDANPSDIKTHMSNLLRRMAKSRKIGKCLVVTDGSNGAYLAFAQPRQDSFEFHHIPPFHVQESKNRNCTGAGDTFAGVFAWFLARQKHEAEVPFVSFAKYASKAAAMSIQSHDPVSPHLNAQLLKESA